MGSGEAWVEPGAAGAPPRQPDTPIAQATGPSIKRRKGLGRSGAQADQSASLDVAHH